MVGKNGEKFSKLSASQMLSSLIDDAISSKASFIHIEPQETDVLIRFRVDGALIEKNKIPKKRFDSLVERIKSLANLETKVRNIVQDGRFKITSADSSYTLKVSIMPTIDGEKISINLLGSSKMNLTLKELGYWGEGLKVFNNSLKRKSGLILLCGPRDSGKSLSLYGLLNSIEKTDKNIATIEDPVEYKILNVNQTEVNHKTNLTFSRSLKSLEKHDFDIVMISELRDTETLNMVIHDVSRGKLIISSLYADNIFEAINKMINSGINRHQLANTLILISNQRLVRRLCDSCRVSFTPDKASINLIYKLFGLNDPLIMKSLHILESRFIKENYSLDDKEIKNSKYLSTTENRIKRLWRASDKGCDKCHFSGYIGRLGLFEIINVSPAIESLITSLASSKVLVQKATNEGTINLFVDGLIKALQGQTSINEIYKLHQDHY